MKTALLVNALAVLIVWGTGARLAAQQQQAGCGSLPYPQERLEDFARYFRDDDLAAVRGTKIRQLTAAETQARVTDASECQVVMEAAVATLRQFVSRWGQIEAAGYDFAVFRYGPYYAVLIHYAVDPATGEAPHYLPLMIFRADDLAYLRTILV